MAEIIELKSGEHPPSLARHALVISSQRHPVTGTAAIDRGHNRIFFADDSERDIAMIIGRAMTWANARQIMNVYLRRE
jgi:hypothetical protein